MSLSFSPLLNYSFNTLNIPKTRQSQQNWWKKMDILVLQNKICCHSHHRKCSKSCFSTALFYYVLVQRCMCTPPCPNWPSLGLHLHHQASVRGRLNLWQPLFASLLSLEDVLQGWEWPWFMNIKEGKMRERKLTDGTIVGLITLNTHMCCSYFAA